MPWTKAGTVTLTKNSKAVSGVGTNWKSAGMARAGDVFVAPGNVLYEVASIESDTALTLVSNYLGNTASGQAYSLIHTGLLPAELAANLADLQKKYLTTISQLYEWETSSADTVNLTNPATGVSSAVMALKKFLSWFSENVIALGAKNSIMRGASEGSPDISGRAFPSVAHFSAAGNDAVGAIVFTAPTTPAIKMWQFRLIGKLYQKTNNLLDVIISAYLNATGTDWLNTSVNSLGTWRPAIRMGVAPNGNLCIIVGNVTDVVPYGQVHMESMICHHSGSSDAIGTGWTTALVTDLSGYTVVTADLNPRVTGFNLDFAPQEYPVFSIETSIWNADVSATPEQLIRVSRLMGTNSGSFTYTLPDFSYFVAAFTRAPAVNTGWILYVQNFSTSGMRTIVPGVGWTAQGSMVVSAGVSAQFLLYRAAGGGYIVRVA